MTHSKSKDKAIVCCVSVKLKPPPCYSLRLPSRIWAIMCACMHACVAYGIHWTLQNMSDMSHFQAEKNKNTNNDSSSSVSEHSFIRNSYTISIPLSHKHTHRHRHVQKIWQNEIEYRKKTHLENSFNSFGFDYKRYKYENWVIERKINKNKPNLLLNHEKKSYFFGVFDWYKPLFS